MKKRARLWQGTWPGIVREMLELELSIVSSCTYQGNAGGRGQVEARSKQFNLEKLS